MHIEKIHLFYISSFLTKLRMWIVCKKYLSAYVACKERVRLILVFLSPSLDLATNKWHALSLMSIDASKMVSNSVFSTKGVFGIISKFEC